MIEKEELDIDRLATRFFDLFTNSDNKTPNVNDIENLFIKEGTIINNTLGNPIIYGIQDFMKPRVKILSDGTLTDFSEYEISHKTTIFKNIAHRFCKYEKSGKLNGKYFKSEGKKSFQFVKIDDVWKISSVIWCD